MPVPFIVDALIPRHDRQPIIHIPGLGEGLVTTGEDEGGLVLEAGVEACWSIGRPGPAHQLILLAEQPVAGIPARHEALSFCRISRAEKWGPLFLEKLYRVRIVAFIIRIDREGLAGRLLNGELVELVLEIGQARQLDGDRRIGVGKAAPRWMLLV